MADFEGQLLQMAISYDTKLKRHADELEKQYLEAETQLREQKAGLDLVNLAVERLQSFRPRHAEDLQCFSCWIDRGVHSRLLPIASKMGEVEHFRCETCDREIEFEA